MATGVKSTPAPRQCNHLIEELRIGVLKNQARVSEQPVDWVLTCIQAVNKDLANHLAAVEMRHQANTGAAQSRFATGAGTCDQHALA